MADYQKNIWDEIERGGEAVWNALNQPWSRFIPSSEQMDAIFDVGIYIREIKDEVIQSIDTFVNRLTPQIEATLEGVRAACEGIEELCYSMKQLPDAIQEALNNTEYIKSMSESRAKAEQIERRLRMTDNGYVLPEMNTDSFIDKFEDFERDVLRSISLGDPKINFLATSDIFVTWSGFYSVYEKALSQRKGKTLRDLSQTTIYTTMSERFVSLETACDNYSSSALRQLSHRETGYGTIESSNGVLVYKSGSDFEVRGDKLVKIQANPNRTGFVLKDVGLDMGQAKHTEVKIMYREDGKLRNLDRTVAGERQAYDLFAADIKPEIEYQLGQLTFPAYFEKHKGKAKEYFQK